MLRPLKKNDSVIRFKLAESFFVFKRLSKYKMNANNDYPLTKPFLSASCSFGFMQKKRPVTFPVFWIGNPIVAKRTVPGDI